MIKYIWLMLLLTIPFLKPQAQEMKQPYHDLSHHSSVFGHLKYYRIYLPKGYEKSNKRYPVIYFFHGWGGRYFKDDNALLDYARIKDVVDQHQIILVMWDGNIEENEPRPYNIGNHKDIRYNIQMKDYFPELMGHIDSSFHTLTDRNHRGIIGFSMGGIMSFFLAGKYPDRVCAAVNLAGTPEFFIGYPDNHTLYPVRYTFRNLMEVNTRQHGGDSDILVYLNEEVRKGALWEGNPYEFYGFRGGHMIDPPGEIAAFDMAVKFVSETFDKGMPIPAKWSHYDLYDTFDIWGYQITSNKKEPGFIHIKNVSPHGFGLYTRKWLPDGPDIPGVMITVATTPIYEPGKTYNVVSCAADRLMDAKRTNDSQVKCGKDGRIVMAFPGNGYETGIYTDGDNPDLVVLDHDLNDHVPNLSAGNDNRLYIELFNRAGDITTEQKLRVKINSLDADVSVRKSHVKTKLKPGRRIISLPPFYISCAKQPPLHGEPFQARFRVTMELKDSVFEDDIIVPVLFNAREMDSIRIDDGIVIREKAFGNGNADGNADAGENIMIYHNGNRLRLYTNDKWVIASQEKLVDEQIPAIWEDGFTLSSVVAISGDCPNGHVIEFTGNYETNTWNPIERKLHWGKIYITVNNKAN